MINEDRALLSRVANCVFWMARYIERAENIARTIDVNLRLQLDLPFEPASLWQPLIDTSGDTEVFRKQFGTANESNVVHFLAFDDENPNSISACLRAARENARSVRETISSEMWEQVNTMYLQIQAQRSTPQPESLSEVLRGIRLACHMFQGITDATMSCNEAWHFLRLGKMLERADKTSRILDVKYFILLPSATSIGSPYDDLHWSAVLKSVSGFQTYRQKHGRISPNDIVELLVLDREFPRAIRHCANSAGDSLRAITGTPSASHDYPCERLMAGLHAELGNVSVEQIIDRGLHEYLDGLQTKINAIGDALLDDFFVRLPADKSETALGSGDSN